jgi:hypothetical protein
MFVSGFVLAGLGIYAAFVGSIWFLTKAFSKGILWGLFSLIFPPVALVFAIKHWGISWRPLALNVVGSLGAAGGAALLVTSIAQESGTDLMQGLQALEQQANEISENPAMTDPSNESAP